MSMPILILECWQKHPLIRPHIASTNHQSATILGTLYRSAGGEPLLVFPGDKRLRATLIMNPPERLMRTLQLLLEGEACPHLSTVEAILYGAPLKARSWVTNNPEAHGAIRVKSDIWRS
jgi:hypothetical protein